MSRDRLDEESHRDRKAAAGASHAMPIGVKYLVNRELARPPAVSAGRDASVIENLRVRGQAAPGLGSSKPQPRRIVPPPAVIAR